MESQPMDWTGQAVYWNVFNQRVIDQINKRKTQGDFVCVINGWLNKPLENLTGVLVVEYAIGYDGTFAKYRVFASHAHRNKIRGVEGGWDPDGLWFDTVIPHYLDSKHYRQKSKSEDYYLYIGRLTERKGIQIAIDTCKYLGVKLKVAGAGDFSLKDCEYVGVVSHPEKVKLYQGAIATFCPTTYLEPFNMTVIESQMCGTPVISSPFGAFPENVQEKCGFRCEMFGDFVRAALAVCELSPTYIRAHAVTNWDINTIKHAYARYFQNLLQLWNKGWYTV
jgi:glycosyltransferase involved in cell wall biosynthesis